MFKHHLAATSLAFALMSATAIAQTAAPAPAAPNTAPNSTMAPSTAAPAASGAQATLAPQNQAMRGNWRASKLMGVDIYGPDNQKVGDVTEVLIDSSGKITGVTVGVGGFLGIGAKDVAVKFEEVNWSMQPMAATATGTAATGTSTATNAGTAAPGAAGTAATAPRATGTAGTAATAPMDQMYPDHGKINMTKDQLNAAPAVTYSNT
ncbi:MAG TPA: PRC-barrel domain-containing protein [Bosea sp. (in: a-proteobacteria)]|jgi:sporulation protein YlmC with PRC-barrel domain|uniref:PRC-barrel domain-containing protein n=1 Tax=Bosea sp. (in: a-proteobacteria) TaxID=1871050 RepID=UPI002DDDA588|nr:PRC-barrel domain-containing protein [Bosea sp. (in: a-proteobacteria)]HEV2554226.1 PRC-barrel domain-containing protein [Bosea sp. (in: a-proteobacteria)]